MGVRDQAVTTTTSELLITYYHKLSHTITYYLILSAISYYHILLQSHSTHQHIIFLFVIWLRRCYSVTTIRMYSKYFDSTVGPEHNCFSVIRHNARVVGSRITQCTKTAILRIVRCSCRGSRVYFETSNSCRENVGCSCIKIWDNSL